MTRKIPPVAPGRFAWDPQDVPALLTLEQAGPLHYRNIFHDPNRNGRAFGGQPMAQALVAAMHTVESDRVPALMQVLFLQGVRIDAQVDYRVDVLQDGKRFSSRHVRGMQGDVAVLDVNFSFQVPDDMPEHQYPMAETVPAPESLASNDDIDPVLIERYERTTYSLSPRASLDFRFVDPERELFSPLALPRLRYWIRIKRRLPDDLRLHAAALTYLSDYRINHAAIGPHWPQTDDENMLYIASLNHSVWFHMPCRADEWLLVIAEGTRAISGRALTRALFYSLDGALVASVAQEALMARRMKQA
jgi:acyl-CoA thioesterase-2